MVENKLQQVKEKDDEMLVFSSQENFEQAMRMAKCLSASTIVPTTFQGDKGLANCIIALEMANRMKMPPLMVMQNLYVVYGNVGWSSKFLIASVNTSGKFATPLRYEFKGTQGKDDWGCRACATDVEGNVLKGSWVDIAMAKSEGWYTKNGSKWKTMPELMLQYRAGAFFQRAYAPEISMGLVSAEELQDIGKRSVIDANYNELSTETVVEEVQEVQEPANESPSNKEINTDNLDF